MKMEEEDEEATNTIFRMLYVGPRNSGGLRGMCFARAMSRIWV